MRGEAAAGPRSAEAIRPRTHLYGDTTAGSATKGDGTMEQPNGPTDPPIAHPAPLPVNPPAHPSRHGPPQGRCAAAAAKDPTPCEGPHDAATLIERHGGEVAGCVHHCARLLAGLEGARVHPFVPAHHALEIYSRARELPPFAWEIGK
ncbi:hypothetical protein [Streptomyces sp. NPDC048248]|uniref:hypothetical protein n=1 Tax=Streptomyces sp. NPDC048248 TaxID=3365523 RepID=UPI0037191C9C